MPRSEGTLRGLAVQNTSYQKITIVGNGLSYQQGRTGNRAGTSAAEAPIGPPNRYPVPDWVHQQAYLNPYPTI